MDQQAAVNMGWNLQQHRDKLRLSLGEEDYSNPKIFTDDDLLNMLILNAVDELTVISPLYTIYEFQAQQNIFKYDLPDNILSLDKVTMLIQSDIQKNEIPIDAIWEPHENKVNIISLMYPVFSGGNYRSYITIKHTPPDEKTNSTLSLKEDRAVQMFAIANCIEWIAIRMITKKKGVISYTVGRYEEKSNKSLDSLFSACESIRKRATITLDEVQPNVIFTGGDVGSLVPKPDLSKMYLSIMGWNGDAPIQRTSTPGKAPY